MVAALVGDRNLADELVDARGRVTAAALPEAPFPNVIASALNADMHWMAVAMEASDGTTALARARRVAVVPGEHADRPNRIAHYWLDLARAWLLHDNRDRCVDALARARAISPEHARYNPSLHETIATLAAQDARRTDSLAGLARWAGVRF